MKYIYAIIFVSLLLGTAYAKIGMDFGMGFGVGSVTVGPPPISNSVSKEDGTNGTKEDGTNWLTEG